MLGTDDGALLALANVVGLCRYEVHKLVAALNQQVAGIARYTHVLWQHVLDSLLQGAAGQPDVVHGCSVRRELVTGR
jgi:hypothetical protein